MKLTDSDYSRFQRTHRSIFDETDTKAFTVDPVGHIRIYQKQTDEQWGDWEKRKPVHEGSESHKALKIYNEL